MKRLALTLALLLSATGTLAQIYQWKDESGKTILSDKPPPGQIRPQRQLESQPTTPVTQPQKTVADRDLEFRKRQKESQEGAEKSGKEQAAAAERKEVCDNSRRHLQLLESGERIAMRDDKGERYFLEDAQREQELVKARQAVQTNCK